VTAAKVRVALIEQTGALDVYFEETIEILMPDKEGSPVGLVEARRRKTCSFVA
jgi:hypothetical protein